MVVAADWREAMVWKAEVEVVVEAREETPTREANRGAVADRSDAAGCCCLLLLADAARTKLLLV